MVDKRCPYCGKRLWRKRKNGQRKPADHTRCLLDYDACCKRSASSAMQWYVIAKWVVTDLWRKETDALDTDKPDLPTVHAQLQPYVDRWEKRHD